MIYQLEATKDQFELILKSLDFYSRIQMGQVSELANPSIIPLPSADYAELEEKINIIKKAMFPELEEHEYFSVQSKKIPDTIKQTIDMIEVIKYQFKLAMPPTATTELDINKLKKPYHWSSEQELVKFKQKEQE